MNIWNFMYNFLKHINVYFSAIRGYPLMQDNVPEIIKDLLNCDFSKIPQTILKDDFMLRTKHGVEFYSCIKRNITSHHFNTCLETLTDHCKNSKIRSTKTIRMTLEMADKILTLLPDLKIIYLVRDPRAVIQSRISLNLVDDQHVEEESSELCDRMENDVELIEQSRNKNRIKIVQYEHFAKNSVAIANDIFKFIDYEIDPDVLQWIKANSVRSVDRNPFSTSRNSAKSIDKWISKISTTTAKQIDKVCDKLYNRYGYKRFNEI